MRTYPAKDLKADSLYNQAAPEPREPSLMQKADELLRFVGDLESNVERMRLMLFGGSIAKDKIEQCNSVSTIDDTVARAVTRLACLVGDTGTILARIEG